MKLMRIATVAVMSSVCWGSLNAMVYADDCTVRSPEQRASWIAGFERRLHNHDPAHAARMSKVASQIIQGDLDALKAELNSGLDAKSVLKVNDNPAGGMSLLTLAAAACQLDVASTLIQAGAPVDGAGDSTPLVAASGSGATAVTTLLIQHGANVEKVDENGHSALEDAVRQKHLDTVKVLLAHGGNPNRRVSGGRGTILDLVAHSSGPADQAIAQQLKMQGGGTLIPSSQ